MPENYFVTVRKIQKQQLLKFIQDNKGTPIKQLLGLFSLKTGYKISTLEVYVTELKEAGLVE